MRIIVNGEERDVSVAHLDAVLLECGYENPAIATALNGTFIHRHLRAETATTSKWLHPSREAKYADILWYRDC